jgi:hypothetical protein
VLVEVYNPIRAIGWMDTSIWNLHLIATRVVFSGPQFGVEGKAKHPNLFGIKGFSDVV